MPRPTRFIADQFRQVDESAAGIGSTGELEAKSFQNVAAGLNQLGGAVTQYQERKRVLDQRRVTDDATNASIGAAQASLDNAKTSPDAHPDGSDMVDTFNEGFDEIKASYMDTLSNDTEKSQADIIFERQRLSRTEKLLGDQRQKHLEYTVNKAEQSRIGYNSQVLNDPNQFSLALQSVEDSNSAMLEAGVVPPDKIDLLRQKSRKDLIYSAVDGMTLIGQDYQQAVSDVVEGRFSMLLDGDEKRKMIGIIQQRKMQAANSDLQEINREQAESNKVRKANQEVTFQDLFGKAIEANNSDSRAFIGDKVDAAIARQLLPREDGEYIKSFMAKPRLGNFDDQSRSFQISTMIVDGQNLDEVNRIIKRDMVSNNIHPDTAERLLQKSAMMSEKNKVSGTDVGKEKMRLAKDHLDALYGSKEFLNLPNTDQKKRFRRQQAGSMLLNRMIENPDMDPRQAAVLVGQELSGDDIRSYPTVPGVSADKQNNVNDLIKEIAIVQARFTSGAMTKEKRSRLILDLQNRIKTIDALEAAKKEAGEVSRKLMEQRKRTDTVSEEQ